MSPSRTAILLTADLVYRNFTKPRSDGRADSHSAITYNLSDFECYICQIQLPTLEDLGSHLQEHGLSSPYTCGLEVLDRPTWSWGCGCHFDQLADFYRHLYKDSSIHCLQSRPIGQVHPEFQHLLPQKAIIPLISISPFAADDSTSDPPIDLRPLPNNFKHRYDSTSSRSSRRSGKSDEGYHSLNGDAETPRDTTLADCPPSSYRSETLDSTIREVDLDPSSQFPVLPRRSASQHRRYECPYCPRSRTYIRLHNLKTHIKTCHPNPAQDKHTPTPALANTADPDQQNEAKLLLSPSNGASIRTPLASTRQPKKSRRALPGDLFHQKSQAVPFVQTMQGPELELDGVYVQVVCIADPSPSQPHTLKRNSKSDDLRSVARKSILAEQQFPPTKSTLDSALSVQDSHRELVSPDTSRSTPKHSTNSESEQSFIAGGTSFSRDVSSIVELDYESHGFVTKLADRIIEKYFHTFDVSAIRSHATWQDESNGSTVPSHGGATPPTSISTSSKRARQSEDNEDDSQEDEQKDRAPDSKRKRRNSDATTKLFACPYAKFDPERYSERNHSEKRYRKCASKYLNSITRVKQHLYRTHTRPSWYCGNCYESFESREHSNQHDRKRPRCESQPPMYEEMMTDDQFQGIKRRSVGNSAYESWFKIFQILFPAALKPLSPYVSTCDPATVAHFVAFFRRCGPQELLNLMRDQVDQNGDASIQLAAPTQAIVDEAFEIAIPECLSRLHEARNSLQSAGLGETIEINPAEGEITPQVVMQRQRHSQVLSYSDRLSRVLSEDIQPDQRPPHSSQNSFHDSQHYHRGSQNHEPNQDRPDWPGQNAAYLHGALDAMEGTFNHDLSHSFVAEEPFLDPAQVETAFDAYELPSISDGVSFDALTGTWTTTSSDPSSNSLEPSHGNAGSVDIIDQWQYLGSHT